MPTTEPQRCIRCHAVYTSAPHIMAGRRYCCASCSVGSACEHQGIRRPVEVRRFDTMFEPFRQVARTATPYEREVVPHASGGVDASNPAGESLRHQSS